MVSNPMATGVVRGEIEMTPRDCPTPLIFWLP